MEGKLKLYGFNNLTKALSFNIYDVCYAKTPRSRRTTSPTSASNTIPSA